MGKIAYVAGATGLIGRELVQMLLNDKDYSQVIALVRTKLNLRHPKLEQRIVDFEQIEQAVKGGLKDAYVFCTLGTTIKKAKTKEAFKKVDCEYPLRLARISAAEGSQLFSIVTALGASEKSKVFYSRVKGEVEEALRKLKLPSLHVFRPSFLLGDREEFRMGERVALAFAEKVPFIWKGPLAKYKPVHVKTVARAMIVSASQTAKGVSIRESSEIPGLAAQYKSK